MGTHVTIRRLTTLGGLAIAGLGLLLIPTVSAQTVTIAGGGGAIKSSPVAFSGMVYFGNGVGAMVCRDATTGTGGWTFDTRTNGGSATGVVLARPALTYIGGVYYLLFTTNDGYVFCLNASTGAKVWSVGPLLTGATTIDSMPAIVTGPTLGGSVAYVSAFTTSVGQIFALQCDTGATLATSVDLITTTATGNKLSSPAAYGPGVFVGVTGGTHAGFRLDAGLATVLTQLGSGLSSDTPPMVYQYTGITNPRVLVATTTGYLCAYNVSSGGEAFTPVAVTTEALTSPVVYNDVAYMATPSGKIQHASVIDGTAPGGSYDFSKAVAANKAVLGMTLDPAATGGASLLFGTSHGWYTRMPIADPAAHINFKVPGGTAYATTPTIDATTGTVLIGNDNGNVYGFTR